MQNSHETTLWPFGAGTLAGALLGMLFAPLSGRETRARLGRRIRRTAASAQAVGQRLRGERRPSAGAGAPNTAGTEDRRRVEPGPGELLPRAPIPADRLP